MLRRVSLLGAPPARWKSLQRTYQYYRSMLSSCKDLEMVSGVSASADCRIYFRISEAEWPDLGNGAPHLVALHGGCVIDRATVRRVLGRLRQCDGVIVNCSSDRAIVESMIKERCPVVVELPLGVRMNDPGPDSGVMLRQIFGFPPASRVIAFVSRMVPHKNAHQVLRLIELLAPKHDVRALVVGDYWGDYPSGIPGSEYRSFLTREFAASPAAGRVFRLTGGLDDHELALLMSGSDILYHPSITLDENFGYVPVEAMACGTPVVCLDYGGMKDSVEQGVSGFRARTWATPTGPRADYLQSYSYVARILSDPGLHRSLRGGAAERGRCYRAEVTGKRLIDGLWECLRRFERCKRRPALISERESVGVSRWQVYEPGWDEREKSVELYASSAIAPPLNEFTAIRKYGRQTVRGFTLYVDDPLSPFEGPLSEDERSLLEFIGSDWVEVGALSVRLQRSAATLLSAGVLESTACEIKNCPATKA